MIINELEQKQEVEDYNGEEIEEVKLIELSDLDTGVNTTVRKFFKDLGSIPMLTQEEEKDLTTRLYEAGKAKTKLEKFDNYEIELSIKEEMKLRDKAEEFKELRDKLVNANLRLVASIAKKYNTKENMDFMDLVQEGTSGLIKAAEKFDPTKGFKFSTYATWWVRQAITRSITDQARLIRLPNYIVENMNKFVAIQKTIQNTENRNATIPEIAERLGISVSKAEQIQQYLLEPLSLEMPVGEEEETTLKEFIEDQNGMSPYEYTKSEYLKQEIRKAIEVLEEREQEVIKLRFGLEDGKYYTLEEVGNIYGISRERTRQIEASALLKLRHNPAVKRLQDFIGSGDIY